jgi:tetratricopeptide (TPR) repeat protein
VRQWRPGAAGTLGTVRRRQGRLAESADCLGQALAISREIGERSVEAEILNALGETLLALGRPREALASHQAALAVASQIGHLPELARAEAGVAAARPGGLAGSDRRH